MKYYILTFLLFLISSVIAQEKQPEEIILLKAANIIDGKGNPVSKNQDILIVGTTIQEIGRNINIPEDAKVIDCTGKTVLPGLNDMHAHMYGNTGGRIENMFEAYPPLYLAGGVTTAFSPGEFDPTGAVILKERIKKGEISGPHYLTAGPYFDSDDTKLNWIDGNANQAETISKFKQWKNKIDGVKVYTSISEDQFKALVKEAQKAGLFITGHLTSLSASKAIELGINGLEHGVFGMSEFWAKGDSYAEVNCKIAKLDVESELVSDLMDAIIDNKIYTDPTIVIFETLLPDFKPVSEEWWYYIDINTRLKIEKRAEIYPNSNETCDRKAIEKQKVFVKALYDKGGIIVTGTDPVSVKLIPGYGLHREIKILTETGIPNLQAIKAATYNGAVALRMDQIIGSVEVGKRADLVIVNGDPSDTIEDIGNTELVIKGGEVFYPNELRESVKGLIGRK